MTYWLHAENLACFRGEKELWQNINFELAPGQLLQVIGPNGSGKTSLLRVLTGILKPAHGKLYWRGKLLSQHWMDYRGQLAYLGHQLAVKGELTVLEHLKFSYPAKNTTTQEWLKILKTLNIDFLMDKLSNTLSQGQRQCVALAGVLAANVPLWILDEPFSALDESMVFTIQNIWDEHLSRQGMIILTTHRPLTLSTLFKKQLCIQSFSS